MQTDEPAQLDRVMARLADGDAAYAVTLAKEWHEPIARLVRTLLREMGRRDLARDRDEVAGLVLDACFVIADRAGGWRPGGAPPWMWARLAIRAEVARSIGHRCVELDDQRHDECAPVPVDMVDYDELVERDPRFASFDDVLRECTTERDRRMLAYDAEYPAYGFAQHKGYPVRQHLAALAAHGPCAIHRRSFAPVREASGAADLTPRSTERAAGAPAERRLS